MQLIPPYSKLITRHTSAKLNSSNCGTWNRCRDIDRKAQTNRGGGKKVAGKVLRTMATSEWDVRKSIENRGRYCQRGKQTRHSDSILACSGDYFHAFLSLAVGYARHTPQRALNVQSGTCLTRVSIPRFRIHRRCLVDIIMTRHERNPDSCTQRKDKMKF